MKVKSNKKLTPFNKILNHPIFTNKCSLYFVSIVVFLQLINYLVNSKFTAILFFYVLTLIFFKFNKNMIFVLGIPAFITLFIDKLLYRNTIEGLTNKDDDKEVPVEESNDDEVDDEVDEKKNDIIYDRDRERELEKLNVTDEQISDVMKKAFEAEKSQSKSGYTNIKKTPGLYTLPNKEQIKKQMKKADKIEEAYDNLEKVIGNDGIKSISSNTKELVEHQKQLISGLKDITPALDQAMSALGKIDMGKMMNMFNSLNPSK